MEPAPSRDSGAPPGGVAAWLRRLPAALLAALWPSERALRAILLLALALRLAMVLGMLLQPESRPLIFNPDTSSYVIAAQHLASELRFYNDFGPETMRTPGYPLFLLPGVLLGPYAVTTLLLQVLLGGASVLLVARIAGLIGAAPGVAAAAALLQALDPLSVLQTAQLMTETLFATLLLGFLYALVRHLRDGEPRWLVVAALLLVACNFTRPISMFLAAPACVLVVWRHGWRASLRRPLGVALVVFLAIAVLPVLAWKARNDALTGYGGFASISTLVLYVGHGGFVVAEHYGLPPPIDVADGKAAMERYLAERYGETWSRDCSVSRLTAACLRRMDAAAKAVIREFPGQFVRYYLRGWLYLMLPGEPSAVREMLFPSLPPTHLLGDIAHARLGTIAEKLGGYSGAQRAAAALGLLCVAYLALIYLGVLRLGFVLRRLVREQGYVPIGIATVVLIAAYFFAISGGAAGFIRFRHPIMPELVLLAALGFTGLRQRFAGLRQRLARRPPASP